MNYVHTPIFEVHRLVSLTCASRNLRPCRATGRMSRTRTAVLSDPVYNPYTSLVPVPSSHPSPSLPRSPRSVRHVRSSVSRTQSRRFDLAHGRMSSFRRAPSSVPGSWVGTGKSRQEGRGRGVGRFGSQRSRTERSLRTKWVKCVTCACDSDTMT